MYIPLLRERVRMHGAGAEYLVVRADYHGQLADLQSVSGGLSRIANVPFRELFATWENTEVAPLKAAGNKQDASSGPSL